MSVAPICRANLTEVAKGNDNFLEQYVRARAGHITEAEFRRLFDACILYALGASHVAEVTQAGNQLRI